MLGGKSHSHQSGERGLKIKETFRPARLAKKEQRSSLGHKSVKVWGEPHSFDTNKGKRKRGNW